MNGSNGTTGQSDPNASRPPASRIERHAQARPARSGPMLAAQTSIWLGLGSPWYGCIEATTPRRREPPDVGGIDGLDVLDAVPPGVGPRRRALAARVAGPRPVGAGGVLEGVEREADAPVADGVQLHLPAAPVGLGRRRRPATSGSQAGRPRPGVALVGREHRRRPGLDHAVHEALEDPGVQPLAAPERERRGLVGVEAVAPLGEGLPGLHDQRAPEPEVQLARVVDTAPEGELVGVQPRVLGGGQALGVHRRDRAPDGLAVLLLGGHGQEAIDRAPGPPP